MPGVTTVAILFGLTTVPASAERLEIGDAAPQLVVQEFIQGDAVKKFEKGKIYVVDFWSTTCIPCLLCIPHLTQLQQKFSDVTFIGVSVSEPDSRKVRKFVKKMGKAMGYRVALDVVPDGKEPDEGVMIKSWLKAADCGIPTAFIIDGNGKIAWIGDPSDKELEAWLTKIHGSSVKRESNSSRRP